MARKVYVNITIKAIIRVDDDADVNDVINELDYNFSDTSGRAQVEDFNIVPYKGGEGDPIEFVPNDLPEGAKFESRFTELALDGWNKSDTLI